MEKNTREILFRGRKTGGIEWVKGLIVSPCRDTMYILRETATRDEWYVDAETVGQYTGLTDKNGKKIFEGDVVKHYYDDNSNVYDIGRVFWNGATCMFLRTCKSGDGCPQIWDSCEYEVIGNIYDNPELIKGGVNI